ncbi:hypothetical protein C8R44DRAFT_170051 [Mycena epipterygia]|nr:hypothetical protein C8R44DRAFT_170051 [Mycena epipterygia]
MRRGERGTGESKGQEGEGRKADWGGGGSGRVLDSRGSSHGQQGQGQGQGQGQAQDYLMDVDQHHLQQQHPYQEHRGQDAHVHEQAQEQEQAHEQEREETQLLANRAVLRVWVGWMVANNSSNGGNNNNSGNGSGSAANGNGNGGNNSSNGNNNSSNGNSAPPAQAVYGAVGAAHGIVQACRALAALSTASVGSANGHAASVFGNGAFSASASLSAHSASSHSTSLSSTLAHSSSTLAHTSSTLAHSSSNSTLAHPPSLAHLASPPLRALFDAGVVCAHAALRHPTAVFAAGAREGLRGALALMRGEAVDGNGNGLNGLQNGVSNGLQNYSGPSSALGTWAGREEAVRVLEGLARRAGVARHAEGVLPGSLKRKHEAIGPQGGHHDGHHDAMAFSGREAMGLSLNGHGHQLNGHALNGHGQPLNGHGQPVNGHGPGHTHDAITLIDPLSPVVPAPPSAAAKDKEAKEKELKEKKKRASYPSVGIRVRPGKDGSPLVAGRKSSTGGGALRHSPGGVAGRTPAEEMGYYPQAQAQQQQQQYRSRSSSISQAAQDPRMQPPKDASQHVVAMEYGLPYAAAPAAVAPALDDASGMYARRFSDPQQQQQQQAGYAGDSTSAAMYDLQPPRAGSYDDGYGGSGSVGSPFGNSAASSPYTTTSGGLSTPTFGNGNPSPPTYASQHAASPPRFAPQVAAQFYGGGGGGGAGGYEPQQQQQYEHAQLGMVDPYDKGQMYDAKPLMVEHHAQYEPRHENSMGWPPPEPAQAQQYWSADEYKFYPQ